MKLRVPCGCRSVSYDGDQLSIDSDGSIEADETAAGILVAHGFVAVPSSITVTDHDAAGRDEVATLDRRGLFSLLRSRGVSVSLPITNAELRAAARKALAGSASSIPLR